MIILSFDPSKQTPPRTGPYALDGAQLVPGRQEIAALAFSKMQAHPDFPSLLEAGVITIHELEPTLPASPETHPALRAPLQGGEAEEAGPDDETAILSLRQWTVAQATPIVAATTDLASLQRWLATETRITLRQVLEGRIAELQEPPQ